jgi:signal transduction histidine kinase
LFKHLQKFKSVHAIQQHAVLDQLKSRILRKICVFLIVFLVIIHIVLYLGHSSLFSTMLYSYGSLLGFPLLIIAIYLSYQSQENSSIYTLSLAFYSIHLIHMCLMPHAVLSIISLFWIALLISCLSRHYMTLIFHLVVAIISVPLIIHLHQKHDIQLQYDLLMLITFNLYYLCCCLLLFYYLHKRTESYLHYLSKEQQQVQQEYLKAEQAHQDKEYFLSNMSHELRTPLNAILGYTDYHLETVSIGLVEELENSEKLEITKQLRVIQQAGQQLLRLVDDLLQLSHLAAETQSLSLQLLSLDSLSQKLSNPQLYSQLKTPIPSIQQHGELPKSFMTESKYLCRLIRLLCDQLYNYNLKAQPEVVLRAHNQQLEINLYDKSHLQVSILEGLEQQQVPVSDLLSSQNQKTGFLVCIKLCELLEVQMEIENDDERTRFWLQVPSLVKYKIV